MFRAALGQSLHVRPASVAARVQAFSTPSGFCRKCVSFPHHLACPIQANTAYIAPRIAICHGLWQTNEAIGRPIGELL